MSFYGAIILQVKRLLNEVSLASRHTTIIFPDDTSKTVVFTAAGANAWSNWVEIVDSDGIAFSSKAAASNIHITAVVVEQVSVNNQRYMVEVGYGSARTIATRTRLYSGAVPKQETRVNAEVVPAGEKVYYRAMCSQAGPQTCTIHLRYHLL